MAANTTPLLNQTSNDAADLSSALLGALRNHELHSDQMLPAIVESFDRTANTAVIRHLIQWVDMDDRIHDRHPLSNINVLSLGCGAFNISFPLKKGDLGWIIAADRDISLFKQSLATTPPNTSRLHTFSDALFIPDTFRKYTINSEDSDAMVIQSTDSKTRISIRGDNIKITAPVGVVVDTPLTTFTGNGVIEGNLEVKKNVTIDQNLQVDQNSVLTGTTLMSGAATINGGLNANGSGTVTLPSSTTINGVSVAGHGHISSTAPNRTSGGMIA